MHIFIKFILIIFFISLSFGQTTVKAIVVDPEDNYVKNVKVTFTSNVSSKSSYTNANGRVKIDLDAGFNPYYKDLNVYIEHHDYITRKYSFKVDRNARTLDLGILNFKGGISNNHAAFALNYKDTYPQNSIKKRKNNSLKSDEESGKVIIKSLQSFEIKNKIRLKDILSFLIAGQTGLWIGEQGYVVLGRNINIYNFGSFFTKYVISQKKYRDLQGSIAYYPKGSKQASSTIVAGEQGRLVLVVKNKSKVTIRNIKPNLTVEKNKLHFYYLETNGGRRSIAGGFSLNPQESLSHEYAFSVPTIYDKPSVKVSGTINRRNGHIVYNIIDNPSPPQLHLIVDDIKDGDSNGNLSGLESGSINGVVRNDGGGVARGVKIDVEKIPSTLEFVSKKILLGDINPGEKVPYSIFLKAKENAKDGNEKIQIFLSDVRGNEAKPVIAKINTSKYLPPKITLDSWDIEDGQLGLAKGNGNKLAENGESIEYFVTINNSGLGPAYGLNMKLYSNNKQIIPKVINVYIGNIGPKTKKTVSFGIDIPATFKKEMFSIDFQINDVRDVVDFKGKIKTECSYREPILSYDYVIHDGTSGGSNGNKNGLIEQGEQIELEIKIQNDGDLDAEGVYFTIGNPPPRVKLLSGASDEANQSVGKIPARMAARSFFIPMDISFRAEVGPIELDVWLEMDYFERKEEKFINEIYQYDPEEVALGTNIGTGFGNSITSVQNEWINVEVPLQTSLSFKNGFAVIIGNRNYENNDIPQVDYADRDSRTFKTYLTNTFGFSQRNIIDLKNAELSDFFRVFGNKENAQGQLYKQVSAVKKRTDEEVKVFVFYSGHGAPDLKDNRAYLVPSDASVNNIELEGYQLDLLLKNVSKLPTKDITVILDACFSGNSEKGSLYKGVSPALLKVKNLDVMNGVNIFSSSGNDQVSSWYPRARHGVFSYFFFAGLKGYADKNKDKVITNREMIDYLQEKVPEKVGELSNFNREQDPTFSGRKNGVLLDLN